VRWTRRDGPRPDLDVLVVCTGNLCRSPLAAGLLAARLPDLRVASAGTAAVVDAPMHPLSARALAELGIPPYDHRAQQLTPALVGRARLVLGASREHRTYAIGLDPTAADRAFTLKELGRLLRAAPPQPAEYDDGLDAVLATAAAALRADGRDHDDDLDDPMGGPYAAFLACSREVQAALAPLIGALTPARA